MSVTGAAASRNEVTLKVNLGCCSKLKGRLSEWEVYKRFFYYLRSGN